MGRNPTNRGRIGIQPYPIDDLKLQGYVPKTLYVPDDVSVGVSIIAGKNGDGTRIASINDDNALLTSRQYLYSNSHKTTLFNLVPETAVTGEVTARNISIPLASLVTLSFIVTPPDTDISSVDATIYYLDYDGLTVNSTVINGVNSSYPYTYLMNYPAGYLTYYVSIKFTPINTFADYIYKVNAAISLP